VRASPLSNFFLAPVIGWTRAGSGHKQWASRQAQPSPGPLPLGRPRGVTTEEREPDGQREAAFSGESGLEFGARGGGGRPSLGNTCVGRGLDSPRLPPSIVHHRSAASDTCAPRLVALPPSFSQAGAPRLES